jgi:YVTN family beta-propeller protein
MPLKTKLKTIILSAGIAPIACSTLALAQNPMHPPSATLLVVNQGDASLSIVNPEEQRQVAAIAESVPEMVGHEVATSPDGRFAYLPLYGNAGVGRPGTDGHLMLVIDLVAKKIVNEVDFGHGVRPHCVLFERSSGLLYVTTELDRTVTIVDPHTLKIVGSIPTNQEQSHMLATSHDGKFGYTANVSAGTVSVLDLAARKFVTAIPISSTTQRISVSNDDKLVFTADQSKPQLAVIDTATNQIRSRVALPGIGYGSASSLDGANLFVTLPAAGALAILDLKTMRVTHTIQVGERPQEVLVQPDGKTAYVSCFGGHQVAVIDLKTLKVTAMIDVGAKADGMAWAEIPPS